MIVLFNPRSTSPGKQPLPLSVMSLAAVLEGVEPWTLVDGNIVRDPAAAIISELAAIPRRDPALLAVTVMPGPQLTQAVAVCRAVRAALPHVAIVWGGYFPTQHTKTVLASSLVDFVVRSQGERPLLQLIDALKSGGGFDHVSSLSWKSGTTPTQNPIQALTDLDDLPDLPYGRVDMEQYIQPNYLGRRTIAHNSSFGCPFACSFCAVVAMSNRRWLAQTPARLERVLRHLATVYGIDAVQMHDMDFFIAEARTAEFAERITPLGLSWWGLGRIDTLMQYSDRTWRQMARSGLRMVFSGAESSSDTTLVSMNKGGKSAARLALELARRMREYGIVPEYSFVIGAPPNPAADLERTFEFVRAIKQINPATEIVLYTYTPVPMEGALYSEASRLGFTFPSSLEEWASPRWQQIMMRRGEGIPWMDREMRTRVRDFERVLNAYYPTVTDRRLTRARRRLLRAVSAWRYRLKIYTAPYELRALHRVLQYQRPETTGF
jgi:radical SAM superfamily enzyme YgiQ (UPF0313 family)